MEDLTNMEDFRLRRVCQGQVGPIMCRSTLNVAQGMLYAGSKGRGGIT